MSGRRLLMVSLMALTVPLVPAAHAGDAGKATTKAAGATAETPKATPSEAALVFAGGFSDQHLKGMLQRVGAKQPVMVQASRLNGELLVAVFEVEVNKAIKKYGARWKTNMALAWSGLLNDDEMASLALGPAKSPHLQKYIDNRSAAGQAMGKLSGDLFRKIVREVLKNTMASLTKAGKEGAGDAKVKTPARSKAKDAKAPAKE